GLSTALAPWMSRSSSTSSGIRLAMANATAAVAMTLMTMIAIRTGQRDFIAHLPAAANDDHMIAAARRHACAGVETRANGAQNGANAYREGTRDALPYLGFCRTRRFDRGTRRCRDDRRLPAETAIR